ncbi:hypothetical protein GE21DRAFT_10586 [Neurospora crassa]|uniref:Uncharacterized protein n=1 Tax=Neurospora crassa (strain ATCC 24698 / 74-OR23-1A / CBS 708.71 / DSM 1257 / FGSC 987) TaxID=367110 RepID=Q7S4I0_NEUCR|nr:hypothetical protein NCU08170 [Neurospora crassa OR74A]EAA30426.1 hypothetical protein NCU08170 [Neurospora crassa OR74A]KHE80451.1 hypothetical protein GE21DRAFT_10586 [Neurospora crassa]|eukprot:XP_959662.1 hypothetical protein NCU08170 [Neurospora crassa OR74A]
MGATLSQQYIPLLPRSIKSKSKKRPRYLFRLRIRCKKKETLPEIHAPFANPGHDHREESRDSKLDDGSSAEGEESSPSHQSLPISFTNDKPLPKLPLVITPAAQFPGQQAQLNSSSELPATEAIQPIINAAPSENINQEDDNEDVSDSEDSDFPPEIERPHTPPPWDTSLSGYGSVLEVSRPFRARRVFGHPLVEGHFLLGSYQGDNSFLSNGGGPIAAEERRRMWRVWESTKEKEKERGKGEEKEKEKGEYKNGGVVDDDDEWKKKRKKMMMVGGLKSARQLEQKAIERENERERERKRERERGHKKEKDKDKDKMPPIKTKTKTKTKTRRRMSEWRKWKPLPRYPACTAVAQRATSSMWADTAATGDSNSAWREVFVEEAEDREYQGGDEEEEEDDDDEDLEEAIKRFLEIKIPVDLSSLRRLRTSFAGTGEHAMAVDDGTGETAKKDSEKEVLEKVMEGEQGQLSPVESLMFTDTDIEGFEFLFEEEDEGGGIWDLGTAEGVKSERVEGKSEACQMDRPIGGFAGGDASRAESSEEDAEHHLTVRTAFNITQRLSRWKERE